MYDGIALNIYIIIVAIGIDNITGHCNKLIFNLLIITIYIGCIKYTPSESFVHLFMIT